MSDQRDPTDRFYWISYDLRRKLPEHWQEEILTVASNRSVSKTLLPRSVTSREGDPDLQIPVETVSGERVRKDLPWLYALYHGFFRDLAQLHSSEAVTSAQEDVYGAVLSIQKGVDMRYEAHVDSNPIEGLLYVTSHPEGSGGELVVANNPNAANVREIDEDASIVYPAAGNLIFFDARRFPHYVRALKNPEEIRVVVAMNYYTQTCPESSRPPDLTPPLFGYQAPIEGE